ncbi:MAG: metallophosphoesterase [Bryobacteraceae bacterium]
MREVEISPGILAHASGALILRELRTILVADVHMGYGWAQRRRGQLGPVHDAGVQQRVQALIDELNPATVIFLGDVVHAPRPSAQERALVEQTLQAVATRVEIIAVRGNHDRSFARDYPDLGIRVVEHWQGAGLLAMHGDHLPLAPPEERLVIGHIHPAIGVRDDAGASRRIPAFLVGARALVLPAFSPLAAGFDVSEGLPRGIRKLCGPGGIEVIAATGNRAVRLPARL